MEGVHPCVKLSGTDAHKCDPVPVCLIHICLNFKYKSRKIFLRHRIDVAFVRMSRKRRRRHFEEMLQEGLYSEVGKRRSEEDRRKLSFIHQILVKLCTCSVQKLDLS